MSKVRQSQELTPRTTAIKLTIQSLDSRGSRGLEGVGITLKSREDKEQAT